MVKVDQKLDTSDLAQFDKGKEKLVSSDKTNFHEGECSNSASKPKAKTNSENTTSSTQNYSQHSQKPKKTANFSKKNSYYSTFSDSGASNVSDNFQRTRVNHFWKPKG